MASRVDGFDHLVVAIELNKTKEMFFRLSSTIVFRSYLKYFQLFGQCPVIFNHSKKWNNQILIMISFIHIILLTLTVTFVCKFSRQIFFDNDSFGEFNDTIKFTLVVVAYYAIVIESYLKRDTQSKIWNLLGRFYRTDRFDEIEQSKLWDCKEFNIQFFGYFGLVFLAELYRMPFNLNRSQSLNYWCLSTILLIASRSRHMQYIFYLNIVKQQLRQLFKELKRIEEYSKYNRSKLSSSSQLAYNQFLCRRLFLAREHYSLIFEISTHINEAFGWSHLVNLTHSFVQILTDVYWCYWNIDNKTYVLSGDSLMGTVPSIVIVILVFGYTTKLHEKAKKTSFYLHSINQIDSGSKTRDLIESFSLQLIHEPIIFRAQGCFKLDLSILGDATAAITTYMVFFIQFTPRYKS